MYALVRIAGRQYRVTPDENIEVDRLPGKPGERVGIDDVLMVADGDDVKIGTPNVPYRVNLEVVSQDRRKKVIVYHFKRRGGRRRTLGHRQPYTVVKVQSIEKRGN